MRWFAAICTLAVLGVVALWWFDPGTEGTVGVPTVSNSNVAEPAAAKPKLSAEEVAETGTSQPRRAPLAPHTSPPAATPELPLGRLQGRILDPGGLAITFADRYSVSWVGHDRILRNVEGELSFGASFDTGEAIEGRVVGVALRLTSSGQWTGYGVDPIEIARGEVVQHDLTLPAQCEFHLHFRNAETGEPIVGAVFAGDFRRNASTDEHGNIDITEIAAPTDVPIFFTLRHPDYPPFRGKLVCPEPAWPVQREFAVPSGSSLNARVVMPDGAPVPGVQVHCSASIGAQNGLGRREELNQKSTLVHHDGSFTLRGFQPGLTYRLRIERGRTTILSEELIFPEASRRKRFVVHPTLSTIGLVLDADGNALPNTGVVALGPNGAGVSTATTDAEGSFELANLFPGEWFAYVEYGEPFPGSIAHLAPRRIVSRRFRVQPSGAERVDLRLPGESEPTVRAPFTVFAFDRETHTLIRNFSFSLNGIESTLSERAFARDGERGYPYSAPVGRYEIVAQAYGYEAVAVEFELASGGAPQRVEVWLAPYE